jgi:hypothetical protein
MKGSMSGDSRDFNIDTRALIKFFSPCMARRTVISVKEVLTKKSIPAVPKPHTHVI